jgi:hypothetical protein
MTLDNVRYENVLVIPHNIRRAANWILFSLSHFVISSAEWQSANLTAVKNTQKICGYSAYSAVDFLVS